ncbi:hypothetical protein TNCV_4623921 [Trichonephila clavipes]|nr:hypothetical protein TNCV_4623921 [Trichonephila clavipes]
MFFITNVQLIGHHSSSVPVVKGMLRTALHSISVNTVRNCRWALPFSIPNEGVRSWYTKNMKSQVQDITFSRAQLDLGLDLDGDLNKLMIQLILKWYWTRTRDKASHDPIPIPLGYRGHHHEDEGTVSLLPKHLVVQKSKGRFRLFLNIALKQHDGYWRNCGLRSSDEDNI